MRNSKRTISWWVCLNARARAHVLAPIHAANDDNNNADFYLSKIRCILSLVCDLFLSPAATAAGPCHLAVLLCARCVSVCVCAHVDWTEIVCLAFFGLAQNPHFCVKHAVNGVFVCHLYFAK